MKIEIDYTKATVFYEKACNASHSQACYWSAFTYLGGQGAPRNLDKAKQLYEKACKTGHSPACDRLQEISERPN